MAQVDAFRSRAVKKALHHRAARIKEFLPHRNGKAPAAGEAVGVICLLCLMPLKNCRLRCAVRGQPRAMLALRYYPASRGYIAFFGGFPQAPRTRKRG